MHTQKLVLTNLPKKLANVLKDSHWKSDKIKISCLFPKIFSLPRKVSLDMGIAVLTIHPKKTHKNSVFLMKKWRWWRNFFRVPNFFLKTSLQWRRIQFWQPCRNFSAKSWIFLLKFQIQKKLQFLLTKLFLLKKTLWARRMPSWHPFLKESAKNGTTLPSKWWDDENIFFRESLLSISSDHLGTVLNTLPKKDGQRTENFLPKVQNR